LKGLTDYQLLSQYDYISNKLVIIMMIMMILVLIC